MAKTLGFAGQEIIPAVTPDLIPEKFETGKEKQRPSKTIARKSILPKPKSEQSGYSEKSLFKKISDKNIQTNIKEIKEPEELYEIVENLPNEKDGKEETDNPNIQPSDVIVNPQEIHEDKVESPETIDKKYNDFKPGLYESTVSDNKDVIPPVQIDKEYNDFKPDLYESTVSDNKDVIPPVQKNTTRKISQLQPHKDNEIQESQDIPKENLLSTKNTINNSSLQEYSSKEIETEKNIYQKTDLEINNNKELIRYPTLALRESEIKPNQDQLNNFESETTITVNIGKIEIRAIKQESPNKKQQSKFVPPLSLNEYLKIRKGIQ